MRVGRLIGQMPALPSSVTCFWTWTWRHVDDGADGVEGDDEDEEKGNTVSFLEVCGLEQMPSYVTNAGSATWPFIINIVIIIVIMNVLW